MSVLRPLALPGYVICAWLVVFSLADAASLALPPVPASVEWRYSLVALLSRTVLTPLLGLFIALVLAALLEQTRMLKFLAWVSLLGALALLVATGVFVADSFQIRGEERPGIVPPFTLAWGMGLAKLVIALVVTGLMASAARWLANLEAGEIGVVWGAGGSSRSRAQ